VIDLGNIKLNVIETPAHTPGSVTYVDQQNNLIASGDSIGSTFVWLFDKKSLNTIKRP
jgi:Zn-dependent hydrolases, including glyoxylases